MIHKAKIIVESNDIRIKLDLGFLDNPTAQKISASLPLQSKARTWGDEIYFDIGIAAPSDGATMDVAVGDIAYWPTGKCLCIFFGPTPASSGKKPVPASEVVIVAKSSLDPGVLRKVKSGAKISVEPHMTLDTG